MDRKEWKQIIARAQQEAASDSKWINDAPAMLCERMFGYINRAFDSLEKERNKTV